jgi:hypothetical protein
MVWIFCRRSKQRTGGWSVPEGAIPLSRELATAEASVIVPVARALPVRGSHVPRVRVPRAAPKDTVGLRFDQPAAPLDATALRQARPSRETNTRSCFVEWIWPGRRISRISAILFGARLLYWTRPQPYTCRRVPSVFHLWLTSLRFLSIGEHFAQSRLPSRSSSPARNSLQRNPSAT